MDLRDQVAAALDDVRRRSTDLLDPLDEADLVRQHSPIMSPLVWDLAHVGNYEDIWLVRALGGSTEHPDYDDMYDAFRHPRPDRPALPLLGPGEARRYVAGVRARALDRLEGVDLEGDGRLTRQAFVYGMVVQHEHQHDETMLATLQLMEGPGYRPVAPCAPASPAGAATLPAEILVPAGAFVMGTSDEPWAYDNEGPAHVRDLDAFFIDTLPVTNRAFVAFVDGGGYDEARWWDAKGWEWRQQTGASHPAGWRADGSGNGSANGSGGWQHDRFGWHEDLPLDQPVQHVCWFEADAYARWARRRLPTEAEWEKAASWGPDGVKRRYPWGDVDPTPAHTNLGQRHYGPAAAGAYPAGASAYGVHQLVGDVWEWTSSGFDAYAGFESFPYREYSEVFWGGDHRVLRGGSWATHPRAVRTTFRNWDHPYRRQVFAGFRTARDAS